MKLSGRQTWAGSGDAGRERPAPARVAVALLVAAALVACSATAFAKTYKWVDDKGVVHYSDKLPPEALPKGSTELTKEGIPLRRTEAPLTPDQQRVRAADEERARQTAKEHDEAERRDRALLASYTNEGEIDLARDRTLATIEAVLASAQAYSEQLDKRRVDAEARRATYRGKPVPVVLERELEGIASELQIQAKLIAQKRVEHAATVVRYDADRARWRELKLAANASPAPASAGRSGANPPAGPAKSPPPK